MSDAVAAAAPPAAAAQLTARLAEFKQKNANGGPSRQPPALPAAGPQPPPPPPEPDVARLAATMERPGLATTMERAHQFLDRTGAEPPTPSAPPRGNLTVELTKDVRGFGVEYTVTADARLVVVSCAATAAGEDLPSPGHEIIRLGGQEVAGSPEAMRAALDSVRASVQDGDTVEWMFAPPQGARDDETVRMAENMAAHLTAGRAAASPGHAAGAEPPRESGTRKSKTELQHEWRHNAVWDIESGLWASPFFGAFEALRFFSLTLLAQLLLIVVSVYTTDGLAFPGWIVFCMAVATLATGFPGWWEPMTNKHLRLHMIVSAISAAVTLYLAIFLRDRYATLAIAQREKIASLHIGIAAMQLLGCMFAFRTQAHAVQVDEYIRARLEEEKHARRRALALHRLPFSRGDEGDEHDFEGGVRDGLLWALDHDEQLDEFGLEDTAIFDPDLRRLDARLRQSSVVSGEMYEKNSLLAQVLRDNEKRNRQQLAEMQSLARNAVEAQVMCERATAKLNYFE